MHTNYAKITFQKTQIQRIRSLSHTAKNTCTTIYWLKIETQIKIQIQITQTPAFKIPSLEEKTINFTKHRPEPITVKIALSFTRTEKKQRMNSSSNSSFGSKSTANRRSPSCSSFKFTNCECSCYKWISFQCATSTNVENQTPRRFEIQVLAYILIQNYKCKQTPHANVTLQMFTWLSHKYTCTNETINYIFSKFIGWRTNTLIVLSIFP